MDDHVAETSPMGPPQSSSPLLASNQHQLQSPLDSSHSVSPGMVSLSQPSSPSGMWNVFQTGNQVMHI